MKSLIKDLFFSAICLVIISAASIQLYSLYNEKLSSSTTERIGSITFKKKTAERKYSERVIWEGIAQNSPIFNFDAIRTEEGSIATIHLTNGVNIQLDENTLILVNMSGEKIDINFTKGSISARGGDEKNDSSLSIKTKDTIINVNDGSVNLSGESGKTINLNIEGGSAEISSAKGITSITSEQTAVIDAESIQVKKILLKPVSPVSGEFFVAPAGKETVLFSWKAVGTAMSIIDISSNSSFNPGDIVVSRPVQGTSVAIVLPAGSYFWRLRSKDGQESPMRKFNIISDKSPLPLVPHNNSQYTYTKANPVIQFKWSGSEFATSYVVEISKESDFRSFAGSIPSEGLSVASDVLEKGEYYYRIKALYASAGSGEFLVSPINTFSVIQKGILQPPQLLSPGHNMKISFLSLKNKTEIFNWSGNNEFKDYEFQLGKDPAFKEKIYTERTERNYVYLQKIIPQGTYYWRVRGITVSGEASNFSNYRALALAEPENIIMLTPKPGDILDPAVIKGTLQFSWVDPNNGSLYVIKIAGDDKFSSHVREIITDKRSVILNEINYENLFWKVSLLDQNRKEITAGSVHSITIGQKLQSPDPLSPVNNVMLDMTYARALYFSWKTVKNATHYKIVISRQNGKNFQPFIKANIVVNNYVFTKIQSLKNGSYSWDIQALKIQGDTVVNASPSIKSFFQLKSIGRFAQIKKNNVVEKVEKQSDVLEEQKNKNLDAPIALSPINNAALDLQYAQTIYFSWQPVNGATHYRLILSQIEGNTSKPIINRFIPKNMFILKNYKLLSSGDYKWELQAVRLERNSIIKESTSEKYFFNVKIPEEKKQKKIKITSPDLQYVE